MWIAVSFKTTRTRIFLEPARFYLFWSWPDIRERGMEYGLLQYYLVKPAPG